MAKTRDFIDKARGIHPDLPMVLTPMYKRIEDLEATAASAGTVTEPLTAALNANSQQVNNLADPVAATDAVNLQTLQKYVDAALRQKGL